MAGLGLNVAVDKNVCRKGWIEALIDKEGSVQAFAAKVETDPNYVSSLLSEKGKRNVGDLMARKIERAYRLPQGALDYHSLLAYKVANEVHGMPDEDLEAIMDFVKFKKIAKA